MLGEFRFIVWLRAAAVVLVFWHHIVVTFCRVHKIDFAPNWFVTQYFAGPLKLDLGQVGVYLFFLVSGFIITFVAMAETRTEFAVKRIFRIYPPVIVAVLLTAAANATFYQAPTAYETFRSMLILNGLFDGNFTIVPLMWTLVLELMFYFVVLIALPALKRWPVIVVLVQLGIVCLFISITLPQPYTRLGQLVPHLIPLFVGQVIYLGWSGRMHRGWMLGFLLAWWIVDMWAMQSGSPKFLEANAVAVWRLLTYLTFALLLSVEDKLPLPRAVAFIGAISYSIYLLQLPFGYAPLEFTTSLIGYPAGLALAIALTLLASWASYHAIERPSQKFARSILKWPLNRRPTEPLSVPAEIEVHERLIPGQIRSS